MGARRRAVSADLILVQPNDLNADMRGGASRSIELLETARTKAEHQLAISDEAAAYIADALMQLALEFENNHYAQIRRHYQAIAPEPERDPRQLHLFPEESPAVATLGRG